MHSSRRAERYYIPDEDRGRRTRPDYFRQLYPHMLIQDVSVSIMPIGGRTEKRPFDVVLTPADSGTESLLAGALSRGGYRTELRAAVCDFVQECAQVILAFGEAHYELVYFADGEASSPFEFEVTLVQPGTVSRRWGKLVQYIPPEIAKKRGLPVYLELPEESVVTFTVRAALRRELARAMDALGVMSRQTFPPFVLERGAGDKNTIPFDVTVYNRARKVALATATRYIGWNARGLLLDEALEYYWLHRELLFERFKIELRTQILGTLSNCIERASRRIGFSSRLEVEGLPTPAEVEAAQAALEVGDRPFKEIAGRFMPY
ncbi:MAG: hypothetical protein L0191_01645 [Acidobacteria bacterium]|nr:hypothetical protein [Acidobacteriota bacterium]